jgi:hypothetical protein
VLKEVWSGYSFVELWADYKKTFFRQVGCLVKSSFPVFLYVEVYLGELDMRVVLRLCLVKSNRTLDSYL